jgi:hypothetical protein
MASTPTNPAANNVNALIKGIEDILVPIAENAIVAAVPTLGLPVIQQIMNAIVQGLSNEATKIAELYADFGVIDLQVDSEESQVDTDIQKIQSDEQKGDANAIKQDIAQYQKDTSALTSDDGSGNIQ